MHSTHLQSNVACMNKPVSIMRTTACLYLDVLVMSLLNIPRPAQLSITCAVRLSYCKQRKAGHGPGNEAIIYYK